MTQFGTLYELCILVKTYLKNEEDVRFLLVWKLTPSKNKYASMKFWGNLNYEHKGKIYSRYTRYLKFIFEYSVFEIKFEIIMYLCPKIVLHPPINARFITFEAVSYVLALQSPPISFRFEENFGFC